MDRIEFDVKVEEEGCIRIPSEFANQSLKGKTVHVILNSERRETRTAKRMREKPLNIPGFKPIPRDELSDR